METGNRKAKLFIISLVVSIAIFALMLCIMDKSNWIDLYDKFNESLKWLFGLFVGGNGVEHVTNKVKKEVSRAN